MDYSIDVIGACCICLVLFSFLVLIFLCAILFHLNEWKWERRDKNSNCKGDSDGCI